LNTNTIICISLCVIENEDWALDESNRKSLEQFRKIRHAIKERSINSLQKSEVRQQPDEFC
jgi:hypothetical protein